MGGSTFCFLEGEGREGRRENRRATHSSIETGRNGENGSESERKTYIQIDQMSGADRAD